MLRTYPKLDNYLGLIYRWIIWAWKVIWKTEKFSSISQFQWSLGSRVNFHKISILESRLNSLFLVNALLIHEWSWYLFLIWLVMTSTTAFSIKKPLCWQIKIFFCLAEKTYDGMVEVNRLFRDFFTKCHAYGFWNFI